MSNYIETPTDDASEGQLQDVERKAGAIVTDSKVKLTEIDTSERKAMGDEIESARANTPAPGADPTTTGVYLDVLAEGVLGAALKPIKEGIDFLYERAEDKIDLADISKKTGGMVSGKAKSFETLFSESLGASKGERIELASASLRGNSSAKAGGVGEGINLSKMDTPSPKMAGVQMVRQMEYSRHFASEQHLGMVRAIRAEQAPIRAQMAMAPGGAGGLRPDHRYAPKPPDFDKEMKDDHNWGGMISGTGTA